MPYSLRSAKPLFIYTIEPLIMAIRIYNGNSFTPVSAGPLASLEVCLTQKKTKKWPD
jgi:hypothetical protein